MKKSVNVLVVKDDELRPVAGIWIDGPAGEINSKEYLKKNDDCTIVKATLTEN